MSDSSPLDEGVIKFNADDFIHETLPEHPLINELNRIRDRLFTMNLIGEYPVEKIGFGNLSVRLLHPDFDNPNAFIISGTQTGHIPHLDLEHYTHVVNHEFHENAISVRGPVQASSESLTHAAVYEAHSEIQCVIHVHSAQIWQGMLDANMPHTASTIPYGTPEMAAAVQSIVQHQTSGVLAMAGHEEGVITYGKSIEEAFALCEDLHEQFVS